MSNDSFLDDLQGKTVVVGNQISEKIAMQVDLQKAMETAMLLKQKPNEVESYSALAEWLKMEVGEVYALVYIEKGSMELEKGGKKETAHYYKCIDAEKKSVVYVPKFESLDLDNLTTGTAFTLVKTGKQTSTKTGNEYNTFEVRIAS